MKAFSRTARRCGTALRFAVMCLSLLATACVSFPDAPQPTTTPFFDEAGFDEAGFDEAGFVSMDGTRLAVTRWRAEGPKAVIVALHGMNDYAETYALAASWWAEHAGITTYAIDQRGFGRSPVIGRWPGSETLAADARAGVRAARQAHPGLPVFLMGHSMGAAVVMKAALASAPEEALNADGLILVAPGVWGGAALPFPYRVSLNVAATLMPGKTLTGARAGRQPSDNIEVMRRMYDDSLVIKATRMDTILGVVRLMGEAYRDADSVQGDILFLMGEKDDIIPLQAMEDVSMRLCCAVEVRRYAQGWHLLLRDNQAHSVWRDIAGWIDANIETKKNAAGSLGSTPPAAF